MGAYIREDHLARIKVLGAIPSFLTTADKSVHVALVPRRLEKGLCAFRTLQKHWKNINKFGSCPVRRTALLSTLHSLGCFGFFAFRRSSFGVL